MSAGLSELTELSDFVQKVVNIHGEIHLDSAQTNLLIRWIKSHEKYVKETDSHLREIQKILKESASA